MNRVITLISFLFFFTTIGLYAQEGLFEKKVTISAKNKPLKEVLEELNKSTGVKFSYSHEQIPVNKEITLQFYHKPLKKVLKEVCNQANIQYKQLEGQVVLKAAIPITQEEKQEEERNFTVSGYIKDKETGEALIGATVYDKEKQLGTIANAYGFYSLTLPPGRYNLRYSFMGYKKEVLSINLFQDKWVPIELDIDESQLTTVVIKSSEEEEILRSERISQMKMLSKTIEHNPGFLGEVDFVKSLQAVPGIKNYGDGSTKFYVRGGDRDQNLILLDEAPIYNPSHLLGFFSTFSPEAIKDVKIYKGDIPASHGGRLASLIDIRTREGNMKKYNFYGAFGPLTGNYSLEGPIVKEKSSFFVSLRRSHLGWLTRSTSDNIDIRFWDFNSKLNAKFNENNRLYLSLYSGKDIFRAGVGNGFGLNWGNKAATLRWNHIFSDRLFSNTTLSTSNYEYYLYTNIENDEYWKSDISNFNIKSDFTFYKKPGRTIRFGAKISNHEFNPGNYYPGDDRYLEFIPVVAEQQASEIVMYYSKQRKLSNKWLLKYGLRIPAWNNNGPTTIYEFDDEYNVSDTIAYEDESTFHTYVNLEPRLNLSYFHSKNDVFRFSYARTTQYMQLLSNSISPFTSLEVWLPSGPNIKPQKADQFIVGYTKKFGGKAYEVTTEAYYKNMENQIDYESHPKMLLNPLIEGELRFGRAWSYGTELMLKKNSGILTGWLGYTLSKTYKKTKAVNDGRKYPAFYDRPHDISLFIDFMASERANISANWIYTTGSAISTPTGFFYYHDYTVPIYAEKHNDRLPDYHRLDLSLSYRLNRKVRKFNHSFVFSLYNAYGRKNPISVNFNKAEFADGEIKIPGNLYNHPALEPTKIAILGVIPSIKYKFSIK